MITSWLLLVIALGMLSEEMQSHLGQDCWWCFHATWKLQHESFWLKPQRGSLAKTWHHFRNLPPHKTTKRALLVISRINSRSFTWCKRLFICFFASFLSILFALFSSDHVLCTHIALGQRMGPLALKSSEDGNIEAKWAREFVLVFVEQILL